MEEQIEMLSYIYIYIYIYISYLSGYFGCLCVSSIVNNSAMNIGVGYVYFFKLSFQFPLVIFQGLELLDHMVVHF